MVMGNISHTFQIFGTFGHIFFLAVKSVQILQPICTDYLSVSSVNSPPQHGLIPLAVTELSKSCIFHQL